MICLGSEIQKGDVVYHKLGKVEYDVVKVTKNTVQLRDWCGSTFFVPKTF